MQSKRPSWGIALDSGGAKGGAHLGVMEVLTEHQIPIDIIVGSSAGALAGAIYATGKIEMVKEIIEDLSWKESLSYYVDPVFPFSGLLAGKRARTFLKTIIGDVLIDELPVKFIAVATDLLTGETIAIDKGPLIDALMASISMPGIFKPVVLMDRLLTDGGVSDPLPLDVLKSHSPQYTIACNLHPRLPGRFNPAQKKAIVRAEKQILEKEEDISLWIVDHVVNVIRSQQMFEGVRPLVRNILKKINTSYAETIKDIDLVSTLHYQLIQSRDKISAIFENSLFKKDKVNTLNIFEILVSSTNIQQYQKNRLMLASVRPDILISPDVTDIGSLEFTRVQEALSIGRNQALESIPAIRKLIESNS
ncbi:MAG: patatin-like phospholipase family protein [Deltaproteobacteria bacterium]|nr:patatin-like phospholipase family protein [Deltaproteobacteria bacterium]